MMLEAAAPIFDYQNNLIGILYGGILLNRNFEIVDEIKSTVFQDLQYKGQDIGTATIFQDDLRISTNVKNGDGSQGDWDTCFRRGIQPGRCQWKTLYRASLCCEQLVHHSL